MPTSLASSISRCTRSKEHEPFGDGRAKDLTETGEPKDKAIRREAVMAGLLPGEVLDKNRIEIFRRPLMWPGLFHERPEPGASRIKIEIVDRRPKDKPYGDLMMPLMGEVSQAPPG